MKHSLSLCSLVGPLALLLSFNSQAQSFDPDLFLYHPFDGSLIDQSGNANDATSVGGVVFANGQVGQGVLLDGQDDLIDLANQCFETYTFAAFFQK